jgi:phosphate transport system substrate-binding protein
MDEFYAVERHDVVTGEAYAGVIMGNSLRFERSLRRAIVAGIGTVVCASAVACGGSSRGVTGEITADGSSTVYPLTTAVTEGFLKNHPEVKIAVAISGTGGGFERFCRGETDVQNASRPINAAERAQCDSAGVKYVEVPVAHDGLTVVVNAKNEWATSMTVAELKALWAPEAEKKVTRWSQIRPGWPDEEVHLFGPGPKSGTFDYFTEMVVGKLDASRQDFTASEDDTVIVDGVAKDRLALGYLGYGYFDQNKATLRAVGIDDQDDSVGRGAIMPSPENVRRGVYRPLSRTLFIYVNVRSLDRPVVAEFVNYYLKQDEELVRQVGGIAMSSRSYELVRQRVASRMVGTLLASAPAKISDLEMVLAEGK